VEAVDQAIPKLSQEDRLTFIASGDYIERRLRREDLIGHPAAWTREQCETFEFFMGSLMRQSVLWNLVMLYRVPGVQS